MGILDHLTCLLRNLYAGQEATVRTGHGTANWFQIGKGVCQGCILSPCLFNLHAEYIMRNARLDKTQPGIKISRRNINDPHGLQHARAPCPLPTLEVYSNSCPLSRWCHLIFCRPLLLPPSNFSSIRVFSNESALRIRWPIIRISVSTSVLPVNTQEWSPLGWTGWLSLQSKGLSRVFSNTTVQKHQFFHTQLSL